MAAAAIGVPVPAAKTTPPTGALPTPVNQPAQAKLPPASVMSATEQQKQIDELKRIVKESK
mgnify:CR=1 FL=1